MNAGVLRRGLIKAVFPFFKVYTPGLNSLLAWQITQLSFTGNRLYSLTDGSLQSPYPTTPPSASDAHQTTAMPVAQAQVRSYPPPPFSAVQYYNRMNRN